MWNLLLSWWHRENKLNVALLSIQPLQKWESTPVHVCEMSCAVLLSTFHTFLSPSFCERLHCHFMVQSLWKIEQQCLRLYADCLAVLLGRQHIRQDIPSAMMWSSGVVGTQTFTNILFLKYWQ